MYVGGWADVTETPTFGRHALSPPERPPAGRHISPDSQPRLINCSPGNDNRAFARSLSIISCATGIDHREQVLDRNKSSFRHRISQMDSLFFLFVLLSLFFPASMADSAWNSPQDAIASNETSLEWVKIIVVPVGVFLIGACIWGIIVDTMARWSRSSDARGGAVLEAVEMPSRRSVNDGSVEQDVEEGIELSQMSMEDSTVVVPYPIFARDGMVELELQTPPNNREIEVMTTNIQPQPTTLEIE